MDFIKLFIDKIISNPPKNLDDSLQKEREFKEILQANFNNLSKEDKKELDNYLRDIYNTYIEKVKNCEEYKGGKKSRKRKYKKHFTLKKGVKRGGSLTTTILGLISTLIYIVNEVYQLFVDTPLENEDENESLNSGRGSDSEHDWMMHSMV